MFGWDVERGLEFRILVESLTRFHTTRSVDAPCLAHSGSKIDMSCYEIQVLLC